jgi:hypothetical protein
VLRPAYAVARFTDNEGGRDLPGRISQPSLRLVSLISDPVCAKEGRCEIRRQGCFLELNQRARRSTIRTCPAGLMKLEQLLERPGCGPSGRTAWPARIYKQELFNL